MREAVFGKNWEVWSTSDPKAVAMALLISRLIVNQHVGWDTSCRASALSRCAEWLSGTQQTGGFSQESVPALITQILLTGAPDIVLQRLEVIADVFAAAGSRSMWLSNTEVTDVGPLSKLSQLQNLYLSGTRVTDVSPIQSLHQLRKLYLAGTSLKNIQPLGHLGNLEELNLYHVPLTDLSPLYALSNLRLVYCDHRVPPDELDALRTKLPKATVAS
jgi:hypothetical protein